MNFFTLNPTVSRFGFRYDWKSDKKDERDYLYSQHSKARSVLPPSVDLRSACSPVFDQGKIGSCTANALGGAVEFLERQELKACELSSSEVFVPKHFESVSRMFLYYNERTLEGDPNVDGGASLRDGIKVLNKMGICEESLWPYESKNLFQNPSRAAFLQAEDHRVSQYLRVTSLSEMKQCLSGGNPFVFGFVVYPSFESPQVAETGLMPMPALGESPLGGHAVMAVGYDDTLSKILVRNSWGEQWGLKGYFWMPYDYITSKELCSDFWTLRH